MIIYEPSLLVNSLDSCFEIQRAIEPLLNDELFEVKISCKKDWLSLAGFASEQNRNFGGRLYDVRFSSKSGYFLSFVLQSPCKGLVSYYNIFGDQ